MPGTQCELLLPWGQAGPRQDGKTHIAGGVGGGDKVRTGQEAQGLFL